MVRGSNTGGGEIFRTRPDRPWGPPSLLQNVHRISFPGLKRLGVAMTTNPHLAARLKKEYSYTSTPPLGLRGLFEGELCRYLYFNERGSLNGKVHDVPPPQPPQKKIAAISKF